MEPSTFQKTMIDVPEYKFSDIDIDDFYTYIQRQIDSEKDLVTDKSEQILNMIEFLSQHHVLINE